MPRYELREIPIDVIKPADYNPRVALLPGDPDYEKLKKSVETLGVIDPLVYNEKTGTLIGGHQRLSVLHALGYETVPCFIVSLSPDQEKQANVALNKITGRWDEEKLRDVLASIPEDMISAAGFDPKELQQLMAPVEEVHEDGFDVDGAAAAISEPKTQRGDIIQLGRHRLMCGSSTDPIDVAALFDGERADMVFTDPPYNVDYHSSDGKSILNDSMADNEFYHFLLDAFVSLYPYVKQGGAVYVCHADSESLNFRQAYKVAGFDLKQTLVWVKNSFVLGRQDYQWQHESILYGWKPGASHHWYGDRKQSTVVKPTDAMLHVERIDDENVMLQFTSGMECITLKVPSYSICSRTENSTLWLFDKPRKSFEHPTMKPIPLVAKALQNSSAPGDIIADMFGGSGSTLIAAEQTGRTCYMMELDPKYCDVIIERYNALVGGVGDG